MKESVKGGNPKNTFPLDGFYGLESGICYDKETSVLAIICQKQITLLAFESRETLIQFEIKIRRSLGEGENSIFSSADFGKNDGIIGLSINVS